jgi:predicted nuclease of predicted toxin-antitoxin system
MRVLLDEQLPLDLSAEFPGHLVNTVVSRGWTGIKNGDLLRRMQGQYDVLVTMDRGIEFQHRVTALPFGIVVVRARSNRMRELRPLVPAIMAAIDAVRPGLVQRVGA